MPLDNGGRCSPPAGGFDRAAMCQMVQWPYFNSLYDSDCADDPYDVFSMVYTEGLHAIEVGLVLYMLQIFMDGLQPSFQHKLDGLVKNYLQHP
jgi:hypothetical protein